MIRIAWLETRKNGWSVLQIISLLLFLPSIPRAQNTLECPDLTETKCSCHVIEKGKVNNVLCGQGPWVLHEPS